MYKNELFQGRRTIWAADELNQIDKRKFKLIEQVGQTPARI